MGAELSERAEQIHAATSWLANFFSGKPDPQSKRLHEAFQKVLDQIPNADREPGGLDQLVLSNQDAIEDARNFYVPGLTFSAGETNGSLHRMANVLLPKTPDPSKAIPLPVFMSRVFAPSEVPQKQGCGALLSIIAGAGAVGYVTYRILSPGL